MNERMNIEQAAKYIGVAKGTLYNLTHLKKITHYKPNGKIIVFFKSDLDRYLRQNKVAAV